jgi:hypothetical protein
MPAAFRDRGAFHRTGPVGALLREPFAARCPGWPAGTVAARFHRCSRHRLDLSSRCFRRTNRGRAHPCDFCRWMSPRARPRTTRTSRSAESAVGTTAMARAEVTFRSRQPPKLHRVRGRDNRCSTFPVAIARAGDFAPTPIAPGTWCRETSPLAGLERHGEGWGRRRRAPLQGAPAGRVAWRRASAKRPSVDQPEVPSITQAFASERTGPPAEAGHAGIGAFFTIVEARRETPAFALDGSTSRPRAANHLPSTRRSAPE